MLEKKGLNKDEFTITEHHFKTDDELHKLYVQEWGNPKGEPVLFVHGGPGYYCTDRNKSVFSPKKHRVIFVDQRGAGKSEPYGSLKENDTQKLVDDFDMIRRRLKIDKWHLHGTSWGSTLSLVYAINHPTIIKSIITGGVFLGSKEESDWLNKGYFRRFYPEISEKFVKKDYTPYELTRLHTATIKLDDRYALPEKEGFDEVPAKIEIHYINNNNCFLPKDFILNNASKLTMPVEIVQGRYDMMTPPKAAYELHSKLPNSNLHWTIAGHSSSDRPNYDTTKALLSQLK
jgi:proline iminopeptidase